ncbi:hypothetical protein LguiB_018666 [Lonicera macranthoides]
MEVAKSHQSHDMNYDYEDMVCTVACAAVCARHLAKRRPRMSESSSWSSLAMLGWTA